jgi:hypothetical protein
MATLKVDGLTARCDAHKRYAVAVASAKLTVTKRTNDVAAVAAELRRIARDMPDRQSFVFDLTTGNLLTEQHPGETLEEGTVGRYISDSLGGANPRR